MRKRASLFVKLSVSVILLVALGLQMDLDRFLAVLSSASLSLILLSTAIQVVIILVGVFRWQLILGNFQMATGFPPLTKIFFIGQFFNLFLPSGIGGDVFRAYYLSKREKRGMATTLMTTLLERSAGLCALLLIGGTFAALYNMEVQGLALSYVFGGLLAAYLAANIALFNPWIHERIGRLFNHFGFSNFEAKLRLVYEGLATLRKNRRTIVACLLLSGIIQFLSVVIMWLAALAIHIRAPFHVFLIFIPIVNLTLMIPLTVNGLGLRESVYYLLFSQIGLPVEMSVTLSLLNFAIVALASLPGGIAYSFYKKDEHFDILGKAESL